MTAAPKITIRTFLVENGLYQAVPRNELFEQVQDGYLAFDAYCPGCLKNSTFRRSSDEFNQRVQPISLKPGASAPPVASGFFPITMICARSAAHTLRFEVVLANGQLIKYGQLPSYADILVGDLGVDIKELDKPDQREFVKAHRLFASDAAIGGFVYLRRIFERLINSAKETHETEHGAIENYRDLRMKGKIRALAISLPSLVVDNAEVWDILSAGVHELSEDDCRRYFPFVQSAVVQILERAAHLRRSKAQAEATKRALQAIIGDVNGSASGDKVN